MTDSKDGRGKQNEPTKPPNDLCTKGEQKEGMLNGRS